MKITKSLFDRNADYRTYLSGGKALCIVAGVIGDNEATHFNLNYPGSLYPNNYLQIIEVVKSHDFKNNRETVDYINRELKFYVVAINSKYDHQSVNLRFLYFYKQPSLEEWDIAEDDEEEQWWEPEMIGLPKTSTTKVVKSVLEMFSELGKKEGELVDMDDYDIMVIIRVMRYLKQVAETARLASKTNLDLLDQESWYGTVENIIPKEILDAS